MNMMLFDPKIRTAGERHTQKSDIEAGLLHG